MSDERSLVMNVSDYCYSKSKEGNTDLKLFPFQINLNSSKI